jgi:hypothetical protein
MESKPRPLAHEGSFGSESASAVDRYVELITICRRTVSFEIRFLHKSLTCVKKNAHS